MDVHETETSIQVTMDAPGCAADDIQIEVHEGTMSISGARHPELMKQGGKATAIREERRSDKFQRAFILPESVDTEAVTADLSQGVLTVTIPKKEPVKKPEPKRIKVNAL